MTTPRITIDPKKVKRDKPVARTEEEDEKEVKVSAGAIDKVVDYAFNPSREKIREMTVVDRPQARLLPQLDLISLQWQYTIEIAIYRQDSNEYERLYIPKKQPSSPNLLEEYMYRLAQWQKSLGGRNLDKAIDLALAETEANTGDDDFGKQADDIFRG